MNFLRIENLSFTDVLAGPHRAIANVHVDGRTLFSVQIDTGEKISAGQTIGAFTGVDKDSLVAWLDPVSGECLAIAQPSWLDSPLGVIILAILLAGIIMSAINIVWLFFSRPISRYGIVPSAGALVSCSGLVFLCVKTVPNRSVLEDALRLHAPNGLASAPPAQQG